MNRHLTITLERANKVARRLHGIAEHVVGSESVSSLARCVILTEGRGANAGACLINLKSWSMREHSVLDLIDLVDLIEELEQDQKSKDIGVVIEFFELPAVPACGAAVGFGLRELDQTNSSVTEELVHHA